MALSSTKVIKAIAVTDELESVYSVCLMSGGPIEANEALTAEAGYPSIFKQEK